MVQRDGATGTRRSKQDTCQDIGCQGLTSDQYNRDLGLGTKGIEEGDRKGQIQVKEIWGKDTRTL